MVSFGGVDTGKSNIQGERRERKRKITFTIKLKVKMGKKMEKIMN